MFSDIENVRKMTDLLGDDGFIDAVSNVEELVAEVEQTMDRVEQIEGDAEAAVREANDALTAVDNRLNKFDETMSLIEAKIEAGFSVGFFFFALNSWFAGNRFFAIGLGLMGLLGASSLVLTIVTMPQIERLRDLSQFLADRYGSQSESSGDTDENDRADGAAPPAPVADDSAEPPATTATETGPVDDSSAGDESPDENEQSADTESLSRMERRHRHRAERDRRRDR